jgi:hypothetical protein
MTATSDPLLTTLPVGPRPQPLMRTDARIPEVGWNR